MDFAFTSTVGAALMVAATIPQVVHLARTRDTTSFSFGFLALNAAGVGLLLLRSIELADAGFIALNAFTFAFWTILVALKALAEQRERATLRPVAPEQRGPN